jgi:hypothetical protein
MDTQNSDPQDQSLTPPRPAITPEVTQENGQPVSQQYVSGGNKEHAPIGQPREAIQVTHTEQAPDIAEDVKEAGVEASQPTEVIRLPEEAKQVGVMPAKESVPVTTEPTGAIAIPTPVPPAQAAEEAKGDTMESRTWQATIILRVLKKLGINNAA